MDIKEIKDSQFLKQLNIKQLENLSSEIRDFTMHSVAKTGGHFSSNLGVVELTVALHYVFNFPKDKILFDVGHQAYIHKILSGRACQFDTLRQYQGLSGFQKRSESPYDIWEAGHSSTALSASIGLATARDLKKSDYEVIAFVGDAAIMSGESFEALNYIGSSHTKVIIILNDNNMSITKNVGGLSDFLSDVRVSKGFKRARQNYVHFLSKTNAGKKIYEATKKMKDALKDKVLDDTLFSHFGLDYIGPIDGHNMNDLIQALSTVKDIDHSVVLHVKTIKGKGYPKAEKDKIGLYHGVSSFNLDEGILPSYSKNEQTWSQAISQHLLYMMTNYNDICAVTPAMITGSCLNKVFEKYPERCFDVGIAEEHAMTFIGGLSIGGMFPFLSIYSSFSQRAYDQLNHDIARMNIPCLIGIDRVGLVGEDGSTHHGVFDLGLFMPLPNVVIMVPSNQLEAEAMMNTAYRLRDKPYIIRYSKSTLMRLPVHNDQIMKIGQWKKELYSENNSVTIITYGDSVSKIRKVANKNNYRINLINALFLKPIDYKLLEEIKETKIIVYETIMKKGSLGEAIAYYYADNQNSVNMHFIGLEDHYVAHGSVEELMNQEKISLNDLYSLIKEVVNE